MPEAYIDYDVADGVATIRLDRPAKLNALTNEMALELFPAACRRASDDPAVRAVVVTGTGRAFCAGADIDDRLARLASTAAAGQPDRSIGVYAQALWSIHKPTIAGVNGLAIGAGLSLAAAADFRLAVDSAEFAAGFGKLGLVPDGGLTYTLPELVGVRIARQVLMLGYRLSAAAALACGLLDWVGPADQFAVAVGEIAQTLARASVPAQAATKHALRAAAGASFDHQIELERAAQVKCLGSAEHREGVAAFREHRTPDFISSGGPPC